MQLRLLFIQHIEILQSFSATYIQFIKYGLDNIKYPVLLNEIF